MRTAPACLPCLLQQALFAVSRVTDSEARQQAIMIEAARLLSRVDFEASPPENSMLLYARIAELSACPDPFAELKKEGNRLALRLRAPHEALIASAADPLLAAARLSIAANVIDYGSQHRFDARDTLASCLERPLAVDDSAQFRRDLGRAATVLYLADNCGELVFDGLLIGQLGKETVLAVKGGPIINDALFADAEACGLDRLCRVITNGTACPGTPLAKCSPDFMEAFRQADLIISKGQGNFETLSLVRAPIYFLLTVKCEVVAAHIHALSGRTVPIGEPVLLKSPHFPLSASSHPS